jgi:murein L,D-transpeptidase YcbB/YkuD
MKHHRHLNRLKLIRLKALLRSETVDGQKIQSADKILSFYQARNFSPLWVEGDKISKDSLKTLDQIRESWVHGFNPENYHLSNLEKLRGEELDEKTALVFEVLMSDAVARFGHDLTGMRLSPAAPQRGYVFVVTGAFCGSSS